jgi:large subunit ribosomal protein L13
MKTVSAKTIPENRSWYVVDASDRTLGRLASQLASRLRGKHQPMYTPHADTGDFIVVINAEKVRLTGKKWDKKVYHRHSGYIGGLKSITAKRLREKRPEDLVRYAVWGMLPKNRLGRRLYKKLKVYAGSNHPHEAQKPEVLELPY